ncbi:MAG: glycogen/starch synthase [Muribaculaceae bacterium]|nr:glycogen/starch synthase [Muribaculaceae bacterium]
MELKKVLFISQEIYPYVPETPMSLLCSKLPQAIKDRGAEVRTFMPLYGMINERRNQIHETIRLSGMNIVINDSDHPLIIKAATLQPARMPVYFIYNDDFFTHTLTKELEIDTHAEDNDERSIFYVRGAIEAVRKLRWDPDIIQCSGWVTALAPLYMREMYAEDPSFRDAKIVYALFNDDFEQPLDSLMADKICQDGIPPACVEAINNRPVDHLALTQLALNHSDAVIQCSPNVKPEVLQLVQNAGLPFLPYDENDTNINRYGDFYESLG